MSRLHRHVRLGLLHEGRLVREHLVDRATDVTLGRDPGATLDLHAHPDAPLRQEVLVYQGGWFLVLPPSAGSGGEVSLRGVTGLPAPVDVRGRRCIPIDAAVGGTVQWGAWTVLFQFVGAGVPVTVTREQPVLRLGLVLDDRLLTERAFDQPGDITVGPSHHATMVLPAEEYDGPPAHLHRRRDGTVLLRLPAQAQLVLAAGDTPMTLTQLLQAGHARRVGKEVEVVLGQGARGRLHLGPYALLLQVVLAQTAVAIAPRLGPMQQAARLLGRDRTWAASLLAAALFVGLIVGQALYQQRTVGRFLDHAAATEDIPKGTIEVDLPVKEPDKPTVAPALVPTPKTPEKETPAPRPSQTPAPKRSQTAQAPARTGDDTPAPRNHRDPIAGTMLEAFKTGQGNAPRLFQESADADVQAARSFGGSARDEDPATKPGASMLQLSHRGGGKREVVAGGRTSLGPRAEGVTAAVVHKDETVVVVKIPPLSPDGPDGPGEDAASVGRVVNRKQNAVRRCYETALRDDPDLNGKVSVRFVVGTAGTVTDVEIAGASGALEACIRSVFLNIRGLPLLTQSRSFHQSYVFSKGG